MNIRSKVLSALRWVAITRIAIQIVSWAITIVVIRILDPSDYGLMAIATMIISFLTIVNELGLGAAVVQSQELSDRALRQVFGLGIIINIVMYILLVLASPAIASFFEEERVSALLRVLGVQFLIMSFLVIPQSLLERELDFKRKSIIDLVAMLLGGLTTLAAAIYGAGVWSLVAGSLVTVIVKTLGLNFIVRFHCIPIFSLKGMKKIVSFSGYITMSRILWSFYSQSDILIAGKLLGKEILGYYSVALHLATLPMQKISGAINQVAFPAFSRVQSDVESAKWYLIKAVGVMSFLAFPLMWGISSVAPELVGVFLGQKWEQAQLPLQLISIVIPIRMLSNLMPSIVQGLGRPDISLINLVIASIIMPVAFLFGSQWGLLGISVAWVAAFPIVFLINVGRSLRLINLGLSRYFGAMFRPVLASASMYGIVFISRTMIEDEITLVARLIFLVFIGAISYIGVSFLINRQGYIEVRGLLGR